MAEIYVEIGNKIRKIRNYKGISLEDLSEKCGIDTAPLSKLERGETNPTIQTLTRVAIGLDVYLVDLVDIDGDYFELPVNESVLIEFRKIMRYFTTQQQSEILKALRTLSRWNKAGRSNYFDQDEDKTVI